MYHVSSPDTQHPKWNGMEWNEMNGGITSSWSKVAEALAQSWLGCYLSTYLLTLRKPHTHQNRTISVRYHNFAPLVGSSSGRADRLLHRRTVVYRNRELRSNSRIYISDHLHMEYSK